ncbi:MAG: hypothetical protein QXZ44_06545 [Ferroplasma sp.]
MIEIIGHEKKEIKIINREKLSKIYKDLSINEGSFVAILNGNPATGDEIVEPGDKLVLLEVFSGG